MRFIRRHGRVIPIRDGSSTAPTSAQMKERAQHQKKAVKAMAVGGVGLGVTTVAMREAAIGSVKAGYKVSRNHRSQEFAQAAVKHLTSAKSVKVAVAGYGVALAASAVGAYHDSKAQKIQKSTFGENAKQGLKEAGAFFGGAGAVGGAAYGVLKGYAKHGDKVRAGAQKLGDEIRVRRARKVKPIYKSSGILLPKGRGK
jgi:hypothetical protein